jgi:subtilisin family serine protease
MIMQRFAGAVVFMFLLSAALASGEEKLSQPLTQRLGEPCDELVPVIILFENASSPIRMKAASTITLSREFSLINGAAAKLTRSQILSLSQEPAVRKVFLDGVRTVSEPDVEEGRARIQSSIDSIGARFVQENLNITGRNVTVAVVDTGIDYTHPDLGGCFGASCRVRGGFDFVGNDSDPWDDHSHGTHVAGIVGAKGVMTGVAPDVSFYALKVCNSAGDCYDSDIIAAVEWAVAHDADVISISLGGVGQPNDDVNPLDEAVDEASRRGFVVSVAAGNIGPGAQTIEHPATGSDVITVGSVNDHGTPGTADDDISSFSCRGPRAFGRLDPDVSAPGEGISSTMPGGGHGVKSGTSMAAPHVSGAAALMLEWNRNLTAAQIRSRLMQSAENISGHVFAKGAGEINVSRAILSSLTANVSGSDRYETMLAPGENASFAVSFLNAGNASRNLTLSVEAFSDAKQYHALESAVVQAPAVVLVPAGGEEGIVVNLSLPVNASAGVYGGVLVAASDDGQSLRVPLVLSVPKLGGGVVLGRVNVGDTDGGDWIYVPLKPGNSGGVRVNLSWVGGNLDAYLYAPNGVLVNYSNASSNTEVFSAYGLSYGTYWAVVHAVSVPGTVTYALKLDILSNFSVSPSSWSGTYGSATKELIFTISNDNESKANLIPVVTQLEASEPATRTRSVVIPKKSFARRDYSYVNLSCTITWLKTDLNLSLTNTRYVDVNLTWAPAHNLDLYLVYWDDDGNGSFNAGEDHETRYASTHDNTIIGEYSETISRADVLYYNIYTDLGIAACNPDNNTNFTGNLTAAITTYDEANYTRATITPNIINLSANEQANITLTFDVSGYSRGEQYNLTLHAGPYAQVPITFGVGSPTTPRLASPPTYSNTSLISLNWTKSYHWNASSPSNEAAAYALAYSTSPLFEAQTTQNVSATAANLTLSDGVFYFRVKAYDAGGLDSVWSNVVAATVDTGAPAPPTVSFLTSGEENHTPTLFWNGSADNISGVASYVLELSWDSSFSNVSLQAATKNTSLALNLSDGVHYARVAARDRAGNTGNASETANTSVRTVFLNEVKPEPDAWAELYNSRTEAYNLSGWRLASNGGSILLSGAIAAKGFLLINATAQGLPMNATEDTILLENTYGQVIDNASIVNLSGGSSTGRSLDGAGAWVVYNASTVTPGLSNYRSHAITLSPVWNLLSLPLSPEW